LNDTNQYYASNGTTIEIYKINGFAKSNAFLMLHCAKLLKVGRVLQNSVMTLKTDMIVNITLLAAHSSTKKIEKKVVLKCTSLAKATEELGMQLHIGIDSQSGLTHSAVVSPANIYDKHPA